MDVASDQPELAAKTVVTTLLLTDLVDSTSLVDRLGDTKAAAIFSQQDRLARDLLKTYGGQEIDKTDGFLMLFARPVDAVLYALAYHEGLAKLSAELGTTLQVRTGIHLGELIVQRNAPEDVARGAKPVEVEGLAKPMAARIMSLAMGGQTLITRSAFDLARRGVVGSDDAPDNTKWMAHGPYVLKGCDEPVEIFEVGVAEAAPLCAPPDSAKARRSVAAGDEETLGWRPAGGLRRPIHLETADVAARRLVLRARRQRPTKLRRATASPPPGSLARLGRRGFGPREAHKSGSSRPVLQDHGFLSRPGAKRFPRRAVGTSRPMLRPIATPRDSESPCDSRSDAPAETPGWHKV